MGKVTFIAGIYIIIIMFPRYVRYMNWKTYFLAGLAACLLTAGCGRKGMVAHPSVLPEPVFMLEKEGTFTLPRNPKICVANVGQNSATVRLILKSLRQAHTYPRLVSTSQDSDIELWLNDTVNSELGDEGYLLEVRSGGIRLSANTETGLLYGYQTLLQLLPADVTEVAYGSMVLTERTILDYPRFGWRGLLVNASGQPPRIKDLKRVVDVMAAYKLNRLCMDGGQWNADTTVWMADSLRGYSRAETEELASYAACHGVQVLWDSLPPVAEELRTGLEAARAGQRVVLAPADYWSFDHYQADPRYQPAASEGVITLAQAYSFDPLPLGTNSHVAANVDGGQCRVATDCIGDLSELEYMLLPRILAVGECLWSPAVKRDWGHFRRKVEEEKERLDHRGYRYCEGSFTPKFTVRRVNESVVNVAIGTEVPNTYIFYTTDRSTPTRESAVYLGPFNLERGTHIKLLPVYKGVERDSVYEFIIK